MDSFRIRPAEHSDLPSVVELVRALAAFEKLPGPDDEAVARLLADACAESPPFELLVADVDGAVIGYAMYFMTYSSFLARPGIHLEDLFVRPERRSGGIGAAFLRELAALAVARGCGRFEWTVLEWNVRAQQFYQSLGARILPDWHICRVEGAALAQLAASR